MNRTSLTIPNQELSGRRVTDKMIIPVRCISCGKPVGHLWEKYKKLTEKDGLGGKEAMDKIGLKRYCCRALFLSHVDLMGTVAQYKRG